MKFVDTPEKAKDREARRKKVQEILNWEIQQAKLEEKAKAKNRKKGQLALGELSLSHFGKRG